LNTPSLLTSVACQSQGFVFTENKAGRLRSPHDWLCFEGANAVKHRRFCRGKLDRRQFELCALAMLGADLHKGMQSARRNVQAKALLKEVRNLTVRSPLAA
jgi:hypothetical protein